MTRNATWRQVVGVAKFSAVGTAFVMAIAMATSYTTQVMLLLAHDVEWASWAVPLTIDVLALMSNLALGLPHRKGYGRKGLWFILTVTLSVSMTLNFMAGSNFIASTAHVWVVVAYLAAEYVRGWVKRYRAALEDENNTTAANELSTLDTELAILADAPVSPATVKSPQAPAKANGKGNTRKAHGPRDPERGYAPRTVSRQRTGK